MELAAGIPVDLDVTSHEMTYEEFTHNVAHADQIQKAFTEPIYNISIYSVEYNLNTDIANFRKFKGASLWALFDMYPLFISYSTFI